MAEPAFVIKPRFDRNRVQILYPTTTVNKLVNAEYSDTFGFYQNQFNVFSYMRLTDEREFQITYPRGTPFVWQPHNSCAWTPTGSLWFADDKVTPCRSKLNEELCYDEMFGSAFAAFLRWDGQGPLKLSPEGIQFI